MKITKQELALLEQEHQWRELLQKQLAEHYLSLYCLAPRAVPDKAQVVRPKSDTRPKALATGHLNE
jgi:hypothetical protein